VPLTPSLANEFPPHILLWLAMSGAAALACALVLVPLVARAARSLGLVDTPGEARRIHLDPTPRGGGVAVFGAFAPVMLGVALLAPGARYLDRPLVMGLLAGGAVLMVVGLIDDRFGVRPRVKLAGQLVAAALAWAVGFRPDLPFVGGPVVDAVLFGLWVVGVSNAFNLVDGMDGLAGSVALAALLSLAVYAALVGNVGVVLPCVVLAAAVGGFLRFNMAPASIFLGDSGSLWIGYALALLTLRASDGGPGLSLLMPLCVLAVPLLDTGAAITRRWLRRVPVFRPDARHIHHRLAALGYGPRGVAGVTFVVTVAFSTFGTLMSIVPRETALTLGGFGAVLFVWVLSYGSSRLAYHEFGAALEMLLSAPRRGRRVIRTQIAVRDLVQALQPLGSPRHVRHLLAQHAGELGLSDVALVRGVGPLVMPVLPGHADEWRLIYPLAVPDEDGEAQCLVLTSARGPLADAGTAERVARALAEALEAWFVERTSVRTDERVRPLRTRPPAPGASLPSAAASAERDAAERRLARAR
jgi:UDP-GlcNAc:undecaprenyl-phosphate GlcNAc-1-phosphate transferase